MSTTSNAPSRPSRKMLGYLRYLAEQTGTSFTYPHTAAEAHREIERLRSLKRESKAEIRREQRAVQDDMATRRGDAAAVRSDELVGYGSSATWAKDPEREPTEKQIDYLRRLTAQVGEGFQRPETLAEAEQQIERLRERARDSRRREDAAEQSGPAAAPSSVALEHGRKGKPHALAGYTVGGEHRLIVVQRIDGLIRVGDIPADGKGKRYLVADHLKTNGELDALIADYNQEVASRGAIPADTVAIDALMELAL